MNRRVLGVGLAVAFVVAIAASAEARPGGGESYSGGGGHSDSWSGGSGGDSDSGGGGELLVLLIRLCFEAPVIGVPLLILVAVIFTVGAIRRSRNHDWDLGPPVVLQRTIGLDAIRRSDPDFSAVVFEDFAFRLFATAHRARSSEQDRKALGPYLRPSAVTALAERAPVGVRVAQVVVGAMRAVSIEVPADGDAFGVAEPRTRVHLEFEANVMAGPPGNEITYFSVEQWTLSRAAAVRSKPPDPTRKFPCPNCGAPWKANASGTQVCAYCNEAVDNGRFDWVVDTIALRSMEMRPPTLTTQTVERGTDLATYMQNGFDERWVALLREDAALSDVSVLARIHFVFSELMETWAKGTLVGARGVISDGLADYLQYWLTSYALQGLRNEPFGMRITHAVLCKLERDRYYDALTVRIFATGFDLVVRTDTGELVKGSRSQSRPFSEYWTFIRAAGRRGAARADKACPHCGAPSTVSMAGACENCGAHLTAGEFDWVLSKIEQDDSYRG